MLSAALIVISPSVPPGFFARARSLAPPSIVMLLPSSVIDPAEVAVPESIVKPLRLIVSALMLMFWPLV